MTGTTATETTTAKKTTATKPDKAPKTPKAPKTRNPSASKAATKTKTKSAAGAPKKTENPVKAPAKVSGTENPVKYTEITGKMLQMAKEAENVKAINIAEYSKRLEVATEYIQNEVRNASQSFLRIGFKLWEIREEKLHLADCVGKTLEIEYNQRGYPMAMQFSEIVQE